MDENVKIFLTTDKRTWVEFALKMLNKYFQDVKIIFQKTSKGHNYNIPGTNGEKFVVCDVIFATPKRWFAFEFFPDETKTRRFASTQNKHLWDADINNKRTKHDVEWVVLGKIAKKNLDDYNHLYNIFCAMGPKFDYKGSGEGVFGVMPTEYSFGKLLEKIKANDLTQKKF